MAFFLLTQATPLYTVKINNIVNKFDLKVSEFTFSDLNKTLQLFTWKSTETSHALTLDNGDFISSIGTFIYKQAYGDAALTELYKDFVNDQFKHLECTGHYNLIIKKQKKLYLYNDILGAWKIYQSTNGVISSSLYMLLELQKDLSLNQQGVYEYVLNGCTFGQKTIAEQITSLAAEHYHVITAEEIKSIAIEQRLVQQPDLQSKGMAELVDDYSKRLEILFKKYQTIPTTAFRSAISGGFDSRLILSCFLKVKQHPELYVYGKPSDKDVVVAIDVADKAGLKLDYIDKSQLKNNLNIENFVEIVERNLFMYDGLSYDGILDNGNDYFDRLNRSKNNKILVNGSVGEIFRHFYYLPNKPISINNFIKSFHSRFDPSTMMIAFNFKAYSDKLADEIKKTLKITHTTLTRAEVEKLYPLLRARYWSAKDMVNNHRFGLSLYPFFEQCLINGTSTIDFKTKCYGQFEAKLINKLSPKLAACNSDYGFPFNTKIPINYKLKTCILTYQRPAWLRQISYAIQSKRHKPQRPCYLKPSYLSKIIDTDLPYMSIFFKNITRLDNETLNRLATLEYIAKKYNFKH